MVRKEDDSQTLFYGIKDDNPEDDSAIGTGTEVGFEKNDTEIHWDTRYRHLIHTKGYFKIHSIQGPYQGWMSMTLRGVGLEHVG